MIFDKVTSDEETWYFQYDTGRKAIDGSWCKLNHRHQKMYACLAFHTWYRVSVIKNLVKYIFLAEEKKCQSKYLFGSVERDTGIFGWKAWTLIRTWILCKETNSTHYAFGSSAFLA